MHRAKSNEQMNARRRSHNHPLPGHGTGPHPARTKPVKAGTNQDAVPHHVHDSFRLRPATAQPSEPIFFPKLQIHFADFPYLHASSGREAVHLGDLLRIWVRFGTKITLSLGFSRTNTCAPDTARTAVLYGRHLPIAE